MQSSERLTTSEIYVYLSNQVLSKREVSFNTRASIAAFSTVPHIRYGTAKKYEHLSEQSFELTHQPSRLHTPLRFSSSIFSPDITVVVTLPPFSHFHFTTSTRDNAHTSTLLVQVRDYQAMGSFLSKINREVERVKHKVNHVSAVYAARRNGERARGYFEGTAAYPGQNRSYGRYNGRHDRTTPFYDGGDMDGREYSGLVRADSGFSDGDGSVVGMSSEGRVSGEGGRSG